MRAGLCVGCVARAAAHQLCTRPTRCNCGIVEPRCCPAVIEPCIHPPPIHHARHHSWIEATIAQLCPLGTEAHTALRLSPLRGQWSCCPSLSIPCTPFLLFPHLLFVLLFSPFHRRPVRCYLRLSYYRRHRLCLTQIPRPPDPHPLLFPPILLRPPSVRSEAAPAGAIPPAPAPSHPPAGGR